MRTVTNVLTPVLILAGWLAVLPAPVSAQTAELDLSASADFSTDDRLFETDDTVYVRVRTGGVDLNVLAIEDAELEIEPVGEEGDDYESELTNHLDSTFTASVPVSELTGTAESWTVRAEIEDESGREIKPRGRITIRRNDARSVLRGVVTDTTSSSITVAGRTVTIADTTSITGSAGGSFTLGDLENERVTVRVRTQPDGSLVASSVVVQEDTYANLEVTAAVDSVTDSTVVVLGIAVEADASTEIEDEDGEAAALSDVVAGDLLEVEAALTGGVWLASELRVEEAAESEDGEEEDDEEEGEDAEARIEGTVEAVASDSLTVGGLTFAVTEETDFEGGIDGTADLATGDVVEIRFGRQSGGYRAQEVNFDEEAQETADEEVEAEGTITALTASSLTVDGTTFVVNEETAIDAEEEGIVLSDLYAGLEVSVEGRRQDQGQPIAETIEVDQELTSEFEVKGEITAISGSDSTITVGATLVHVNAGTDIEGEEGQTLSLEELEVGFWAEAEGTTNLSGEHVAEELEVEDPFESEDVEVTAAIDSVDASQISAGGLTFAMTATTAIEDENENPITADELSVGTVVEVEGRLQSDSSLVALEVKIEDEVHQEGEMKGAVTSVSSDSIGVEGVVFRLTARTILEGLSAVSELSAGDPVEVEFQRLSGNGRVAVEVERQGEDDTTEVELSGLVESTGSGELVVGGIGVEVTSETAITGADGATLQFGELAVGASVEIDLEHVSGTLRALAIEVEESVRLSGNVGTTQTQNGSVTARVAGRSVLVTDETLILGPNGGARTIEDLTSNTFVRIRARRTTASSNGKRAASEDMQARRVRIEKESTTTDAPAPIAEQPTRYRLEQNYPNPFNPTTTISFRLPQAGDVRVAVYDVLGREVAVLVDGYRPSGVHRIRFEASNLPSGTYLYRLEVADRPVRTRKMLLLK